MSGEKATSPCNKFQANIFNKSKCQNCFKSRELHLLTDNGREQAKPLYGGWLCLAPEGTDFENPMQRSRKWQRRFFILYEDGSLSFALDELPSTLPQGTVNLNVSADIADAEPRTGQRNALCIATPEQEIFIRGDNKEIINGWTEQLAVYLRTSQQNQKKKRKVEPVATQVATPTSTKSLSLSTARVRPNHKCREGNVQHTDVVMAIRPVVLFAVKPQIDLLSFEVFFSAQKLQSRGDTARLAAPPPQRRAKSLDRRTSDTPDLLNFKKGWMVKLDENEQWKKYWFVLSMDSLRCYKDSVAEEASDLEGEIDLTRCYNVSEYQVQRNYGFQIHTPKGVFTLSAMTSGIRKNWIQALMKSVRPARAPDVASLPVHRGPTEALPKPDVTRDSGAAPPERDPRPERRTVTERRRKGRYKTFDWAEFRPQGKQAADPPRATAPCSLEIGELERRKRREERRRRYESMLGFPLGWEAGPDNKAPGARALSPKSQRRVEEEIEECWRQVEKTVFRLERKVPLISEAGDCAELTELERKLEQSERTCMELHAQNDRELSLMQSNQNRKRLMGINSYTAHFTPFLQATCERGFASMEESHLKVVEELQHRHRQEVERLLVERDGLLEEESAATATAIEAIKNAHRLELEKEVQRRCQSQDTTGSTHLEDVHRQHREELASYQRELEVLSQQFSLKCLENGHLVQAVDAERKALCQCQQENQDLRTRNQELSGHLAAEITRLCSLAKQDALPLSQGMDVYEMEITLRVKESEVQCLKQEITSLRDDLQAAQRDKRSATKKCKDVYAELSITRAKAEREMEALRENLRLAHPLKRFVVASDYFKIKA
uniref:PH domain-containing protein n=1 Tax=Gasterosteus aculeatus aculeatus TaxID=481459 RepID=A0AAQ4Q2I8_GASAC